MLFSLKFFLMSTFTTIYYKLFVLTNRSFYIREMHINRKFTIFHKKIVLLLTHLM